MKNIDKGLMKNFSNCQIDNYEDIYVYFYK